MEVELVVNLSKANKHSEVSETGRGKERSSTRGIKESTTDSLV
jgi:hypothetical protein